MNQKKGRLIGTILLVAGTCTGSAMFGMPIITGLGGIFPMLTMTTIVWLCMTATGYLFVEATLGMREGANIISLTSHYFGKWGRYLIGIPYFLFSCILIISYPASCIPLLSDFFQHVLHLSISPLLMFILFGLAFAFIAFLGVRVSDRVNTIFMLSFFFLFILLINRGIPFFQTSHIMRMNWTFMFLSAPILFMAFCFHYLVPTLVAYLKRDVHALKRAIFGGIFISYIIYICWQMLIIGAISEGTLWEGFERGDVIQQGLQIMENTPWLGVPAIFLAFFAFVTAFIGLALSLIDLISDWVQWPLEKRVGWHRLWICLALFIPAILLSILISDIIFKFLDKVGGFCFIILNGILPIAMAWRARYHMPQSVPRLLLGEKPLLIVLLLIVSYIIYIQGIVLSH